MSHVLSLPKGCRSIREVIRWKHYSIREERDGNRFTQYDAQSEKQKREALYTSRFAFSPRFSED